jgi:hypothetical protein
LHSHPSPPRHLNSRPRHLFNSRPYLHSDLRQPEPPKLNPLRNAHSRSPYSHLQHPEPFRLAKSHTSAEPQPPINIFQVIQHPHGISPTKPKITKYIPAHPILSAETQENIRVSHCACGTLLPIHRDSWRSLDTSRRRFKRVFDMRFGRRSGRRFGRMFSAW